MADLGLAIAASMVAMGCVRSDRPGSNMCETHGEIWSDTSDACGVAEATARAAISAASQQRMSAGYDASGYEEKAAHMASAARRASAALERVREIHSPIDAVQYVGNGQRMRQVCTGCGTDAGNWQIWPCPTRRAADA